MKKTNIFFGLVLGAILFSGCCGPTGPSGCTTYGEACTEFCEKAKGTQFDYGENCFSQCMDDVKMQGLGDATTCCRETLREQCDRTCSSKLSQFVSNYGTEIVDEEEQENFMQECLGECTGAYQIIGMSLDSCSLFDMDAIEGIGYE